MLQASLGASKENWYVAVEKRIDQPIERVKKLQGHNEQGHAIIADKINECSNEVSMAHDYAFGLHYSIVEHGGFLRSGCGLSHQQWVRLTALERANLFSSRALGAVE